MLIFRIDNLFLLRVTIEPCAFNSYRPTSNNKLSINSDDT